MWGLWYLSLFCLPIQAVPNISFFLSWCGLETGDKLKEGEEAMELPKKEKQGAPWYVWAEVKLEETKRERNGAVAALMRARPERRLEAKRRLREVRGRDGERSCVWRRAGG